MTAETQLALVEPVPQRNPPALTPMAMIQIAIEKGAGIDQLERLMTLQERYEANEARKAYVVAKAAFYAEAPTIYKSKRVGFGNTAYSHATLDSIVECAAPILSKHGLTHSWITAQDEKGIEVACQLQHILGHSERVSLRAPGDDSGKKNAVQAIGSTITYLERYTFMAVTGLAAKDQDNDAGNGRASERTGFVTIPEADQLEALVKSTGSDTARFLEFCGADAFTTIPASKFKAALAKLNQKAGERK